MHGVSHDCTWILGITSSTVSLSTAECVSALLSRILLVDITLHVLYDSFHWTLVPGLVLLRRIAEAYRLKERASEIPGASFRLNYREASTSH